MRSRNEQSACETGREVLHAGSNVELHRIRWTDADGRARAWESAERAGGCGAVMIVAWLVPSERLVLIRQYRPPAANEIWEFPAGLVDPGESPEVSALRELKEETGYAGRIVRMTAATFNSPGLTSETVHQVFVEVDENLSENRNPEPMPEEGEQIAVHSVGRPKLAEFLRAESERGMLFDSKVVSYILGIVKGESS